MNPPETILFLNNDVAWLPDLRVRVSYDSLSGYGPGALDLRIDALQQPDSSAILDSGEYSAWSKSTDVVYFDRLYPEQYATRETALYAVINHITRMREHDTREFVRVRDSAGQWRAPFHPHNEDGRQLWNRAGKPAGEDKS